MKSLILTVCGFVTLRLVGVAYFDRYATNTAAGRFYRTDRWKGVTLVIEKDGSQKIAVIFQWR